MLQCLMLKIPDERCFFTHKNNYPQLIEFAKVCKAEISVIKVDDVEVLALPDLAKNLCNNYKKQNLPKYKILEIKNLNLNPNKSREKILSDSNIINNYIKTKLKESNICIKDLENKFEEFHLTKSAFCKHIKRACQQLKNEGYTIIKEGKGFYRAIL